MKLPDKIRLYIGKRDIKEGRQSISESCPVALALYRKFNKPVAVYSDGKVAFIKRDFTCSDWYKICNLGKRFIKSFDRSKSNVKPTKIILTKYQKGK